MKKHQLARFALLAAARFCILNSTKNLQEAGKKEDNP
jgi:hypothetical protein